MAALVGFELKGGKEAGRALHRCAEAVLPRRQYRRCAQPGDPSGHHHALAADAGGAARDRRDRQLCAPVDRHRAYRRHPRRSVAGPDGGHDGKSGGIADPRGRPAGNGRTLSLWPADLLQCRASPSRIAPWNTAGQERQESRARRRPEPAGQFPRVRMRRNRAADWSRRLVRENRPDGRRPDLAGVRQGRRREARRRCRRCPASSAFPIDLRCVEARAKPPSSAFPRSRCSPYDPANEDADGAKKRSTRQPVSAARCAR